MFLPFFPLKLVAFPDEELNLHIFEPRYRELLADMESEEKTMGICTYLDQLSGYGTEMSLEKVLKRYPDGRLDIKTRGLRIFRISTFVNPVPGKLYSGGDVEFLENDFKVERQLQHKYIFYLKEVLQHLDFPGEIPPDSTSFAFAHKIGLTLREELDLLMLTSESDRIHFLLEHFMKILSVLKATEKAKEKIRQNGHVKHLDPLNF
jgi:hypothetical protein